MNQLVKHSHQVCTHTGAYCNCRHTNQEDTKKKTTKFRQGQGPVAWICGGTFYSLTILCTAHITFLRTVHVIFTIYRPTVYWSTQCDLLLYFREFYKWMQRKSCMSPAWVPHFINTHNLQYFPPYSLLLTVRDYVEFFSTWRWKVYDLWPYVQMPLIQAMKEACDQIEAASISSYEGSMWSNWSSIHRFVTQKDSSHVALQMKT